MCERALPADLARQWEQAYPGTADRLHYVRAALRGYLGDCPVADDVIHLLSELAANAIVHSHSGHSGGTFTVRATHFPNSYVWGEVEDQGSDWDGDLPRSAIPPHGLYFLQVLASAYGVDRNSRGRVVWFRIDYPLAQPTTVAAVNCPALPERQPTPLPAGWAPPRWEPPDPCTLARVHAALVATADSSSHLDTTQERPTP